jgi:peptidoglycan DL-endopeptidase CwlO
VNTCTREFHRHALRLSAALVAAALFAGWALPSASADTVGSKQAQANALASQINALGLKEAALGEQYDGAVLAAQSTAAKVSQQEAAVAAANANAAQARVAIEADAIEAYVNGGTPASLASNNGSIDAADGGLLANEYLSTLASTQTDNLDAYNNASQTAHIAELQLQSLQNQQRQAANATANARNAAASAQSQLQATLNQVKGQLQALVQQAEAAQQAVSARAAQALLAKVDTIGSGSSLNANFNAAPIPVGAGASEAVAAAESRVGMPYVWGAAGPDAFDCSGLVMWAWAHAGVSLPHFSGAQYADTTHISMSQLQPGDLVFFSDTGQHVAMYVGGGMIVEAPHTGATVHIVPLYSEFTLASRP